MLIGAKDSSETTAATSQNSEKQPRTTSATTTFTSTVTTTTTTTTTTRCHDANARRWLHSAMTPRSATTAGDRPRPHRSLHVVLNHRPSSTVLDAIRTIESRQLPLTDTGGQNAEDQNRSADRRAAAWRLFDAVRRPACLVEPPPPPPVVDSLQPARLIAPTPLPPLRVNTLCQADARGCQELGQGQVEGQFSLMCTVQEKKLAFVAALAAGFPTPIEIG